MLKMTPKGLKKSVVKDETCNFNLKNTESFKTEEVQIILRRINQFEPNLKIGKIGFIYAQSVNNNGTKNDLCGTSTLQVFG